MPNSTDAKTIYTDSIVAPGEKQEPRVYVIDDDSEVRRSLHFLLSTAGLVSWPFASAADFLDNLEALEPAPILLDIRMPEIDGVQLMNILLDRGIEWPVIAMTAHGNIPVAVQTIKLGAIEFLEKPFEFEALETCLHYAFGQLAAAGKTVAVRDNARRLFETLSPRETEVASILMQGMSNKTAAHLLSLSVRTIEMHRANALTKLEVKSIAEVVRLASDAELPAAAVSRDADNVIG
jgi:two-component system response regulator FixJ